ncbi:hypothetical protein BLNAU_4901 [Blattamonas nauphoetae]|uniref:Uncharacterized protein n=1 Tax=Blattamonas nauphoetae TaxID=2049346 RepID=A0ABQ9Y8D9_9EUKA|nr:hypothetical protein BLNAU_4901 [Blattamonas nauphoetae]
MLSRHLTAAGIECGIHRRLSPQVTCRRRLSRVTPHSFLWTLLGCWECVDCWCRRTDSVIASNRPEMVSSFGLVVLNAAVFDCHIVNHTLLDYLVELGCAPPYSHCTAIPTCFMIIPPVGYALTRYSRPKNPTTNPDPKSMNRNNSRRVTAVPHRAHIRKRKRRSTEPANPDLNHRHSSSSSNHRSSQRMSLSLELLHTQTHHTLHDADLDAFVTGVEPLLPIDCERKKGRMDHAQRPLLFHSKELGDLVEMKKLRNRIDDE